MQVDFEDDEVAWLTKLLSDKKSSSEDILRALGHAKGDAKVVMYGAAADLRMTKVILNKIIG